MRGWKEGVTCLYLCFLKSILFVVWRRVCFGIRGVGRLVGSIFFYRGTGVGGGGDGSREGIV